MTSGPGENVYPAAPACYDGRAGRPRLVRGLLVRLVGLRRDDSASSVGSSGAAPARCAARSGVGPLKRRTLDTLTGLVIFAAIALEVVWLGLLAVALIRLGPPW